MKSEKVYRIIEGMFPESCKAVLYNKVGRKGWDSFIKFWGGMRIGKR